MKKITMLEINEMYEQGADFSEIVDTLRERYEIDNIEEIEEEKEFSNIVHFNNGQKLLSKIKIIKDQDGLWYKDEIIELI